MNPVVVMAMHGRRPLVEINIRMLSSQGCKIVVAASIQQDFDFLNRLKIENLHVLAVSNNPLGKKWQAAVDHAKLLRADPLIILGSDDFLSAGFVQKGCDLSRDFDFQFFTQWHIYQPKTGKNYRLSYKFVFPLGSGRVFSGEYLDRKRWQLFDSSLSVHLDNFAFNNLRQEDKVIQNPEGMKLLAVKGEWATMNPLENILNAHTISWEDETDIDKHFNFEKPIKDIFKNL